MVFEIGPDPLLTCPLDESHRILKSRMQFHLVRCLKNNKLGTRLKCPWNPLHIIDKFAYEDHYKRDCEDMPGAVSFMCPTEKSRDVGSVPATATNDLLPLGEEDWDAEPGPVGTYDPTQHALSKPVLRIAIGLSKAKKKQHRQAERRRFQELEEKGPIQTMPRRSEEPKAMKEPRPPHTISKSLTINTSMTDDRSIRQESKAYRELRPPHEPSLTLSYKPVALSGANGDPRKSVSSEDGARALDEIPKLCQCLLTDTSHDAMSTISSTCSYELDEMSRRARDNNSGMPNLIDSSPGFSEAGKSSFLDEPTYVPNLVGPDARPEVNDVLDLSNRFGELTTMKKKTENPAAYMNQQRRKYNSELPKLVNSSASLNLLDRKHDDDNAENDVPLTEQQHHLLNGLGRGASRFPKHAKSAPPRFGRGMCVAYDCFMKNIPGPTPEEINAGLDNVGRYPGKVSTNPFEMPENAFGGNTSRQNYTLSDANADEDYSDYGYEKAD